MSADAGGLKAARLNTGWSQQEAASRLGVSQPYYSQMERGDRPLPAHLVSRAVRKLHLAPTVLPIPPLATQFAPVAPDELASALARLGYEGFAHLGKYAKAYNPAYLVVGAHLFTPIWKLGSWKRCPGFSQRFTTWTGFG